MIKQRLKRVTLRTFLLLASILAVTQAASARDVYFKYNYEGKAWSEDTKMDVSTSSDGGEWRSYTLKGASGSVYFRFYDSDTGHDMGASSYNQSIGVNGHATAAAITENTSNCFTFTATAGTQYLIEYFYSGYGLSSGGNVSYAVRVTALPDFKVDTDASTESISVTRTSDASPYKYSVTIPDYQSQSGESCNYFRLQCTGGVSSIQNKYFGPSTDQYLEITATDISINTVTDAKNKVVRVDKLNATGSLTVNFECSSADASDLKITSMSFVSNGGDDSGGGDDDSGDPKVTDPAYTYIEIIGWNTSGDQWAPGNGTKVYPNSNGWYVLEVPSDRLSWTFAIYAVSSSSSKWLVPQSKTNESNGFSWKYTEADSKTGDYQYSAASGSTYTIKVNTDTKTVYVVKSKKQDEQGNTAIPVLPACVSSKNDDAGWNSITAENPVVYLLGDVLNNNRMTPEYEMLPDGSGKYVIEHFAMRDNLVYARVFENRDGDYWDRYANDGESVNPFEGTSFGTNTPGVDYRAEYDPATSKLTLTPNAQDDADAVNLPPFISIVGYNFQQITNEDTPNKGSYTVKQDDDGNTTFDGNTIYGWQESWIQQDASGTVLHDLNGKVMYNTLWPPKNQIFFNATKTTSGVTEKMELNSNNLTFTLQKYGAGAEKAGKVMRMTGADWKTALDGDREGSDYYNLFHSTGEENSSVMEDGRYYVRYVIPNVWILGASKIWTGWPGSVDGGVANWKLHSQWGIGTEKGNDSGTEIKSNNGYKLTFDAGNFMFAEPTYFQTVEFFYCVDDSDGGNLTYNDNTGAINDYSIFYTTRSKGNPSIRAKAVENQHGDYYMTLDGALEQNIAKVEVHRYSATLSDADNWVPVSKYNIALDNENAALVLSESGSWTVKDFNTKFGGYDLVANDENLAEGKYFYGMTLTLEDGETVEKVKSNPISIIATDVRTLPRAYQLLSVSDKDLYHHDYVTYSSDNGDVFWVDVDTDGTITVTSCEEDPFTTDDKLDADKVEWSNKVLVYTACPADFTDDATARYQKKEISGYTLTLPDNSATEHANMLADKSHAAIVTMPYAKNMEFSSEITYQAYNEEDNQYVDGKCTAVDGNFNYTFPVPTPGDGTFSLDVSADATKTGFVVDCPQYEEKAKAAFDNEYEHTLSVSIPVGRPNVDSAIRADVYGMLGTQVETVVNGTTQAYSMTLDATAETDGSIVLDNLDPNDWFTADSQNKVRFYSAYDGDVISYPDAAWTEKQLTPENTIAAPGMSSPKVYRVIAKTGDNEYRQRLVLVSVELEDKENTIAASALAHHDNMHMMLKYNGSHLASDESEDDPMQLKIYLTSDSHVCVLEESEPFHWYAEMDKAELVGTGDKEIQTAYAYFFTSGKDVKGEGGVSITPAAASVNLAAAAETPATHYMFVSPYSEAPAVTDIMTSVDEIESTRAAVKAGKGWIEVNGRGVDVYSADGMCVANGPGRFNVASGVYVVRADGKTYKVVVK